jgi:hypothetical protein
MTNKLKLFFGSLAKEMGRATGAVTVIVAAYAIAWLFFPELAAAIKYWIQQSIADLKIWQLIVMLYVVGIFTSD